MISPSYKLSVFQQYRLAREPTEISDVALREILLVASDFNEVRVNAICKSVETNGSCEMIGDPDMPRYVIEKILRS